MRSHWTWSRMRGTTVATQEQLDSLLRAYGGLLAENHALTARLEAMTAALVAADDMARVLDQEVMPRYMEMIEAFSLGDSVVDPMVRQALDVYRDRRAVLAGGVADAPSNDPR